MHKATCEDVLQIITSPEAIQQYETWSGLELSGLKSMFQCIASGKMELTSPILGYAVKTKTSRHFEHHYSMNSFYITIDEELFLVNFEAQHSRNQMDDFLKIRISQGVMNTIEELNVRPLPLSRMPNNFADMKKTFEDELTRMLTATHGLTYLSTYTPVEEVDVYAIFNCAGIRVLWAGMLKDSQGFAANLEIPGSGIYSVQFMNNDISVRRKCEVSIETRVIMQEDASKGVFYARIENYL